VNTRLQVVAILVSAGLFVVVFELVRRKRLMERYALLWLGATLLLLLLSVWGDLLNRISSAVGVGYGPSALFAAALALVVLLLLHFSLVISRLSDQNKVLAQRLGLLQQTLDELSTEQAPLEPLDELERTSERTPSRTR
jgi:hypothetical protein